jgi:hypothetical protein
MASTDAFAVFETLLFEGQVSDGQNCTRSHCVKIQKPRGCEGLRSGAAGVALDEFLSG